METDIFFPRNLLRDCLFSVAFNDVCKNQVEIEIQVENIKSYNFVWISDTKFPIPFDTVEPFHC